MKELTEKQLRLLNIIWDRGHATTAEIHAELMEEKGYARTTVATMLSRLEKYGFLRHEAEENSFRYYPLIQRDEVQKVVVNSMLSNLFSGDSVALVNHLVEQRQLDNDDISELERILKQRKESS